MKLRAATGAALLVGALALPGFAAAPALAHPHSLAPADTPPCDTKPGGDPGKFWAQSRLNFVTAWSITKGKGVLVGVVDTGLNPTRGPAVLHGIRLHQGVDVIGQPGYKHDQTVDCDGHGGAVTAIIAGQPNDTAMVGVAPDATIMPIKQTNQFGDKTGSARTIGLGIDAAVNADAKVVNVSITTTDASDPTLIAAVQHADDKGVVIVAAAGNDGQNQNLPAYPAAYSTRYDNVIAVSAVDQSDRVAQFSETGNYVTVAAPGVGIYSPAAVRGYLKRDGTSFAAPFVTGTVALLRAANPGMTPKQVRNRITATADAPPATVPDPRYGYGVVNPFLALTSVRNDNATRPTSSVAGRRLPAPHAAAAPDRSLQHAAIGAAAGLVGLAVLVVAGTAVLRGRRPRRGSSGNRSDQHSVTPVG